MRYSQQRESIYQAVMQSVEHPTADMVYRTLRAQLPKLSLGTVYRDLNQLADAGRLRKIAMPDGSCRFDGTTGVHSHIVCERCGRVGDVMLPALSAFAHVVEEETQFHLTSCDVVMRGVCEQCFSDAETVQS